MLHIVLTCIRQGSEIEWYRNTVNDLLLPNTVKEKDQKPHTAGLDDTVVPHINIKITGSIPQYRKPTSPPPHSEHGRTYRVETGH